jgi:hypothetical protein
MTNDKLSKLKQSGYTEENVYTIKYKFGKPDIEGKLLQYRITYDKGNNNIIYDICDDSDICNPMIYGNKKVLLKYNAMNLLIEEKSYSSYDREDGEDGCRKITEYNDKQLMIQKAEYDYSDERGFYLRSKCEYEYNDQDLITKKIYYDSLECPTEMIVYEYK